jgi:hypothetical protein
VGFYFCNSVRFNILSDKCVFVDRVFESMFAEVWISHNKKIIVGTIYRPSVNHPALTSGGQFAQFFDLFTIVLNDLARLNPLRPGQLFFEFFHEIYRKGGT